MKTVALKRISTGVVENIFQVADNSTWPAPSGFELVETTGAQIGYTLDQGGNAVIPVKPLADVKAEAKRDVDLAAGKTRLKFITDIPGQEGVYLIKAEQAQAYATAGYTGTVPPFIAAEATATGLTATQVANRILSLQAAWVGVLGPAIEGARIGAKDGIDAAANSAAVATILATALATFAAIEAQG